MSMPETRVLARIDPLSVGKTLGILYTALGLLGGLFVAAMSFAGVSMTGDATAESTGAAFMMGAGAVVCFPLLYGVIGFVFGALAALLYNVTVRFTGGIRFDLG